MKYRIVPFLLGAIAFSGCAAFQAKLIPRNNTLVVAKEPAYLYRLAGDGRITAVVDSLHGGDTLTSTLYRKGGLDDDSYFLIMRGGDSLWAKDGPVLTAKDLEYHLSGVAIQVPLDQEARIMARARDFMMQHSERPTIETVGSTILTPSPRTPGGKSFQVKREVVGKEVRLHAFATVNGGNASAMSEWKNALLEYMRAGIEPRK